MGWDNYGGEMIAWQHLPQAPASEVIVEQP
jgi:hypothetical protein